MLHWFCITALLRGVYFNIFLYLCDLHHPTRQASIAFTTSALQHISFLFGRVIVRNIDYSIPLYHYVCHYTVIFSCAFRSMKIGHGRSGIGSERNTHEIDESGLWVWIWSGSLGVAMGFSFGILCSGACIHQPCRPSRRSAALYD